MIVRMPTSSRRLAAACARPPDAGEATAVPQPPPPKEAKGWKNLAPRNSRSRPTDQAPTAVQRILADMGYRRERGVEIHDVGLGAGTQAAVAALGVAVTVQPGGL
jgi:hypothetical protein